MSRFLVKTLLAIFPASVVLVAIALSVGYRFGYPAVAYRVDGYPCARRPQQRQAVTGFSSGRRTAAGLPRWKTRLERCWSPRPCMDSPANFRR
jgi:hypothetical protein